MNPKKREINTLPLVYDENCKVLILGTFPGQKSRNKGFYYCDSTNYFWYVLEAIFKNRGCSNYSVPPDICGRRKYLLDHGIAVWDICSCCYVDGSSDKTVEVVETNPIYWLLEVLKAKNNKTEKATDKQMTIYCNGRKALYLYNEHVKPKTQEIAHYLPSTSNSNRKWDKHNMTNCANYAEWENALI